MPTSAPYRGSQWFKEVFPGSQGKVILPKQQFYTLKETLVLHAFPLNHLRELLVNSFGDVKTLQKDKFHCTRCFLLSLIKEVSWKTLRRKALVFEKKRAKG